MTLSASIAPTAEHGHSLQLSLQNKGAATLTIVTGARTNIAYPAAAFIFAVQLRDGRRFRLDCRSCGPGLVAGVLGAYQVTLRPGGIFKTAIPLADFSYMDGSTRHLCTPEAQGALLTATLKGTTWPCFGGLPENTCPESYWTGVVSTTIPIVCGSE